MNVLPLIVGAAGFVSGILCRSFFHAGMWSLLFINLLVLIIFGAWWHARMKGYLYVGVFLLMGILGAGRMMLVPVGAPEVFMQKVDTPISLTGTIVADPDIRETSQRITIEVGRAKAHTRILAVTPTYPVYAYGATVRVSGTFTLPAPFATDGGRTFAYDTYLAKDGVYFLIPSAHIEVIAPPHGFFTQAQEMLYETKHLFEDALARAIPEPYASLAEGLIAGGKQGVGKDLLDAFTTTGLLPIIVLSGYNVMIVAEAVLRALRILPKKFALSIAALVLLLFLLAAGGGSSSVRAGIMACIALFARATGKTYDALRALLIAVILMLLWNPLLLLSDPGFQFSIAATLGLILMSSLIELRLTWLRNAFMRDILASTLAAQLFVLPLLLYQTGNLSLIAIPANILVLPAVPLTMLFSFVAGLISLLIPISAVALIVGLPAYALLWYIVAIAQGFAKLPFAHVIIPTFSFAWVVGAYLLIALVYGWLKRKTLALEGASVSFAVPQIAQEEIISAEDVPW